MILARSLCILHQFKNFKTKHHSPFPFPVIFDSARVYYLVSSASPGQTGMRVDSHESFRQLSSTWAKREREFIKLSSTLMKNLSTFKVGESALEFHAKREWEFELSSTFILVWPGIAPSAPSAVFSVKWLHYYVFRPVTIPCSHLCQFNITFFRSPQFKMVSPLPEVSELHGNIVTMADCKDLFGTSIVTYVVLIAHLLFHDHEPLNSVLLINELASVKKTVGKMGIGDKYATILEHSLRFMSWKITYTIVCRYNICVIHVYYRKITILTRTYNIQVELIFLLEIITIKIRVKIYIWTINVNLRSCPPSLLTTPSLIFAREKTPDRRLNKCRHSRSINTYFKILDNTTLIIPMLKNKYRETDAITNTVFYGVPLPTRWGIKTLRGGEVNPRAEILLANRRVFYLGGGGTVSRRAKLHHKSLILYQKMNSNHGDTNSVQSLPRHQRNRPRLPTLLCLRFSQFLARSVHSVRVRLRVLTQVAHSGSHYCVQSLVELHEFSSEADFVTSDLDVSYQGRE